MSAVSAMGTAASTRPTLDSRTSAARFTRRRQRSTPKPSEKMSALGVRFSSISLPVSRS